jgi:hypothetical protein
MLFFAIHMVDPSIHGGHFWTLANCVCGVSQSILILIGSCTCTSYRYKHQLIDDMVAYALKNEGKYVWACNMQAATKADNDAGAEENGRFNFGQQSGARDGDKTRNASTNGVVIKR